jgi:hypothetical protein
MPLKVMRKLITFGEEDVHNSNNEVPQPSSPEVAGIPVQGIGGLWQFFLNLQNATWSLG